MPNYQPEWLRGAIVVWSEDECTVNQEGHEVLSVAWKRLFGERYPHHEESVERFDGGDVMFYLSPGGRIAAESYPSATQILVTPDYLAKHPWPDKPETIVAANEKARQAPCSFCGEPARPDPTYSGPPRKLACDDCNARLAAGLPPKGHEVVHLTAEPGEDLRDLVKVVINEKTQAEVRKELREFLDRQRQKAKEAPGVWLVIDQTALEYKERYRLFRELSAALKHAQSRGYKDPLGIGINTAFGTLNVFAQGETNVGLIHLELP